MNNENLSPDWENLSYPSLLEDLAFKSISVLHPLYLQGDLVGKRIALNDDGLCLIEESEEEDVVAALKSYLQKTHSMPTGACFAVSSFASPREEKWGFELDERGWLLATAVKIATGSTCFASISFQYNDATSPTVFYKPFVNKDPVKDLYKSKQPATISTFEEFERVKLIYSRLVELNPHKYSDRFSKLLNAVRFFEHFDNTDWFLQKIVLAFVGLESLFTDQSKNEVTYKVSIRGAYYLHPNEVAPRRDLFELLKIAYDVRSSFLHGAHVDEARLREKLKKLRGEDYSLWRDLPRELGSILASALSKAISNDNDFEFFSGNPDSKKENEFYTSLVLGKNGAGEEVHFR